VLVPEPVKHPDTLKLVIHPLCFKRWLALRSELWQSPGMSEELTFINLPFAEDTPSPRELGAVLTDQLYREAMQLAEDSRTYFDHVGQWDRKRLEPMDRVLFSCESLKVTTRLMHAISWLLVRKAVLANEMNEAEARLPERRLGRATATLSDDLPRLQTLPPMAQRLVTRSQDLYSRLQRLEAQMFEVLDVSGPGQGPARALLDRIEGAF
jgi:regulator of CtrA degradation